MPGWIGPRRLMSAAQAVQSPEEMRCQVTATSVLC
jgi:hypothetical protein